MTYSGRSADIEGEEKYEDNLPRDEIMQQFFQQKSLLRFAL